VGPDPQAVTKPKAAKPRSSRYEAADYSAAVEGCIREIQRSISKDPDERREANVHHYRADIVAHAEQILRQRGILSPTAPEQNGQTAVSHPKKYPRRDDRFLPGYGPRVKEDLKIVNALLKAFRYPRQTDTEAYLREQAGDALYERAFKLAARKAVEKAAAEKHRADIKAHQRRLRTIQRTRRHDPQQSGVTRPPQMERRNKQVLEHYAKRRPRLKPEPRTPMGDELRRP
jgi:hypothetical protein